MSIFPAFYVATDATMQSRAKSHPYTHAHSFDGEPRNIAPSRNPLDASATISSIISLAGWFNLVTIAAPQPIGLVTVSQISPNLRMWASKYLCVV